MSLQSAGCISPAGASGSGSKSAEVEREMPLASGSGHCSSSLRCLSFWRISVSGRSLSCSTSLFRFLQAADTLDCFVSTRHPWQEETRVALEPLQSPYTEADYSDSTLTALHSA